MKLNEVQIGGRYVAKVSRQLVVVRVVSIEQMLPRAWSASASRRTHIHAVNEATGRKIVLRSAQRLRGPAQEVQP